MNKLDTEILLAHVLKVPRTYLHTYPEKLLSEQEQKAFLALVKRREKGEPIAYLIGEQEFWSLPFEVNSHTLVPRPETELLVELSLYLLSVRNLSKNNFPFSSESCLSAASLASEKRESYFLTDPGENQIIADLGTGSGAIAIALAYERAQWQLLATDKSANALAVAQRNAERLQLSNVDFYQGDWCQALPVGTQCDAILSNPPYIAEHDPHLQQRGVCCEPETALVSGQDGLDDIRKIIMQARSYLKPDGWLLLEHGYDQGEHVSNHLQKYDYIHIETYQDLAGHDRVTIGQYSSDKDVL